MFDFQYYAPTRVVFGRGVEARTGSLLKELGQSGCSSTTAGEAR